MTTAEREDLYDRMYGEDDDDLSPLERGMMSLRVGGGEDGDFDRAMAFSAINAREAKIKVDALYDFLKDYVPDAHKTKMLVNGLVRLCQRMLNSPACRRQLRFEMEEARAKYWLGRVGKSGEEHIEAADRLLDRWGACDLLQITIRTRRIRHGLEAVERERPRWYTAERKKGAPGGDGRGTAFGGPRVLPLPPGAVQHPAGAGRGPGPRHSGTGLQRADQEDPGRHGQPGRGAVLGALALQGSLRRVRPGRLRGKPSLEAQRADGQRQRPGAEAAPQPLEPSGGRRRCSRVRAARPSGCTC